MNIENGVPNKKEQEYTLNISESALMTVISGVKKLPYEIADPILKGISEQVKSQIPSLSEQEKS